MGDSDWTPLVSVVIPAYSQAQYLGDAIRSVLGQTYGRFEILVVNDASPDDTSSVVRGFSDSRIRLIEHDRNRGLPAARNTAIRASAGEIVALLDADDYFHPGKIEAHVEFLRRHPEIEVTYNARYELHHSSAAVREIWRPPLEVGLADFVLGWPFSPSDTVIRREALFRVGLFDERLFSGGEDVDLPCRLALAGCRSASVDRAMNYRRHHSRRQKKNLPARMQDYRDAVDAALADPRCPPSVRVLRDRAYTNHCLELLYLAFTQGDRELGQAYAREAVRLTPSLVDGEPCDLVRQVLHASLLDENLEHAGLLRSVLDQLPPEARHVRRQYDWAVAYGWLVKATREAIWAEPAPPFRAVPPDALRAGDDGYVGWTASHLDSREQELGAGSASDRMRVIAAALRHGGAVRAAGRLTAKYLINHAFRCYRDGRTDRVPGAVAGAIRADPRYLRNRGVLAIAVRSALGRRRDAQGTV